MRRLRSILRVALLIAITAALPLRSGLAQEITVFAAASLADSFAEIGQRYRVETGVTVQFSFASSSTLARQIEAGAPASIYASASERWMDYLAERRLIAAGTRISPIANRLVLIAPADRAPSEVEIGPDLDLADLLGADGRLAVGDPDHVPAGIYAKQALTALGWWPALELRLARADHVRGALALVARGEAPLGIVYRTDAEITPDVRVIGTLPADPEVPISYPFAIVAGQETPAVAALFAFITAGDGRAVFERFGFTLQ